MNDVMVAYDGSAAARRALVHAAELVGRGGRIAVVNVIVAGSVSSRLETVSDAERAGQQRLLTEAGGLLGDYGVEMQSVATAGDPVVEILSAAEVKGTSVLVVGRGRGRVRHPLRRSVSLRLARVARCDVLVVH